MAMARIGIYGGSFNPPHLGHILAAQEFVRTLELDRLLLIPAAVPPHKQMPSNSPDAATRLKLLELAACDLPFAQVDGLELERSGASYTVDTLRQLRARYPADELILCMGTDMFSTFASWYQPGEICKLAVLAVAHRGKEDAEALQNEVMHLQQRFGAHVTLVENRFVDISSTTVRRLLVLGGAERWLPPQVMEYIQQNGLYGTGKNRKDLSFEELKTESLALHKENRVAHVIGCSETAAKMADQYGVSREDAARAGILHDITKALSGREQLHLCEKYGIITDAFEREQTKMLHAATAAAVAEHVFGENEDVCTAIRWHTSGRAGMSTLEKIIYVADYMEPNRDFPGVEQLRRLAYADLDGAMLLGLEMTAENLRSRGLLLGGRSREAIEDLKARKEIQ
jgi:nicotinate-nucleotide adenylyltransferase